jgi:hypothetical protein
VTRAPLPPDTARFAREWNFALALMAALGTLLWFTGHAVAGALAIGLAAAAVIARWSVMRRQGRGFYGQERTSR